MFIKSTLKKILISLDLVSYLVFPKGTPYLISDTNFGTLTIYFNSNINNKLIYDDSLGYYVNVSSSTVYGYVVIDNTQYSVYFPVLDQPYYRASGSYSTDYKYFTSMSKGEYKYFNLYQYQLSDNRYLVGVGLVILFVGFCGFRLGR